MAIVVEPVPETDVELPEQYELVNGEVREIAPIGAYSSAVANRINRHLTAYSITNGVGAPYMDVVYHLPLADDTDRDRKPDVSFASYSRWPEHLPLPYRGNPVDVVPELMVEVVSPSDKAEDVFDKAFEYLRAGAVLVWVVFPRVRQLYAYHDREQPPRVFGDGTVVEAPEVLPGFTVPLSALFPPLAGPLPPIADDE